MLAHLILTFLIRKLAQGHKGFLKQIQNSIPCYMVLETYALTLSPRYTVRGWAAGTIETYTKEVNEIIKVIG